MRALTLAVALFAVGALSGLAYAEDPCDKADQDGTWKIEKIDVAVVGTSGGTTPLPVYAPAGAKGKRPAVLIIHGFAANAAMHESFARHLTSRGFVTARFENPECVNFDLDVWRRNALRAIDALEAASRDKESSLHDRVDWGRFGVLGHSYGGATTISIATDPRVRAVATLAPGTAIFSREKFLAYAKKVTVPILVVGAEFDHVVPAPLYAKAGFDLLPSKEKLYVEIRRAEHLNFGDVALKWVGFSDMEVQGTIPGEEQRRISSAYFTPWLEKHLDVRKDPCGFTNGERAAKDLGAGLLTRIAGPKTPKDSEQQQAQSQGIVKKLEKRD
ncbi:MAG: alpha/beta hydrolase family protein [Planctomycetota bacterium]